MKRRLLFELEVVLVTLGMAATFTPWVANLLGWFAAAF